jgi:hypothetical protein
MGERGRFWGKMLFGEPNLLAVIHGLLTTTGCGHSPQGPQPMGCRMHRQIIYGQIVGYFFG